MSDIYFVELINAEPYKQYNLTDNMPGMAVEENGEIITVIFLIRIIAAKVCLQTCVKTTFGESKRSSRNS